MDSGNRGGAAVVIIAVVAVLAHGTPEWSGGLLSDVRVRINKPREVDRQEYRLTLGLIAGPGEHSRFSGSLWLRWLEPSAFADVTDLQTLDRVLPLDVVIREAYVDVYGLGVKGLDLRVGRQRIAWGRADRINPTDNIDPDDLEDLWDVGRHLPSDAFSLRYYLGTFSLQAVFVPLFRPAVLPMAEGLDALYRPIGVPPAYATLITLEPPRDSVLIPDPRPIVSSSGGLRLEGRAAAVDFSLSYAAVHHDIPIVGSATVTPRGTLSLSSPLPASVTAELVYPRMHVAGADAAWQAGGVGMWVEGAVFFTERLVTHATVSNEHLTVPSSLQPLIAAVPELSALLAGEPFAVDTPLSGTPFVKWVAGADYTFPCNLYLNVQYAHGFAHEYGDGLGDYVVVDSRWSFLEERIEGGLFNAGLEVRDWKKLGTSWAALWQPRITVRPLDNVAVALGVRLIWGSANSTFGRLATSDHGWVQVEYSF